MWLWRTPCTPAQHYTPHPKVGGRRPKKNADRSVSAAKLPGLSAKSRCLSVGEPDLQTSPVFITVAEQCLRPPCSSCSRFARRPHRRVKFHPSKLPSSLGLPEIALPLVGVVRVETFLALLLGEHCEEIASGVALRRAFDRAECTRSAGVARFLTMAARAARQPGGNDAGYRQADGDKANRGKWRSGREGLRVATRRPSVRGGNAARVQRMTMVPKQLSTTEMW